MSEAEEDPASHLNLGASKALHKEPSLEHSQESQEFGQDYRQEVVYSNSICLILYTIGLYLLFLAIDLLLFNAKSMVVSQCERAYLVSLEDYAEDHLSTRLASARMFLDFYREIALTKANYSATGPCDETRFFCGAVQGGMWDYADYAYGYVQTSYEHSLRPSSPVDDGEVFLYNEVGNESLVLEYRLSQLGGDRVAPQLASIVGAHKSNGYLIKLVKRMAGDDQYEMKALMCGWVPAIGPSAKVCLLTPGSLEDVGMGWDNEMVIISEEVLRVDQASAGVEHEATC